MFQGLIKKEMVKVRGEEYTFHEISSLAWIEKVMSDSPVEKDRNQKEITSSNYDYFSRVSAASIEPGADQSFEELYKEIRALPAALIIELFEAADQVNGIAERLELLRGKGSLTEDTSVD